MPLLPPLPPLKLHTPPAVEYPKANALESAKRVATRLIDAVLDELSPSDALDLLHWLRDDSQARIIETED